MHPNWILLKVDTAIDLIDSETDKNVRENYE